MVRSASAVEKLTGVGSLVSLQVGALGVHLVAAGDVASVDLASLQRVAALVVHRQAAAVPSDAGVSSTAQPYPGRCTLVKHPEIPNKRLLEIPSYLYDRLTLTHR